MNRDAANFLNLLQLLTILAHGIRWDALDTDREEAEEIAGFWWRAQVGGKFFPGDGRELVVF